MAHALPITKLAGLLVKTLAKPLSKRIKHEAIRYNFTKRILIGIGQTSHQVTSRMTIWASGYRVRRITPLADDKAMATGAEFIGETFILLVSGGIVVFEYNRSAASAKAKEAKRIAAAKKERDDLHEKLIALDIRLHALEEAVETNTQSMLRLGGKVYHPPEGVPRIVDLVENEKSNVEEQNQSDDKSTSREGTQKKSTKGRGWRLF